MWCDSRQALPHGGCGTQLGGLPYSQGVTKLADSRIDMERSTTEGKSPVGEIR